MDWQKILKLIPTIRHPVPLAGLIIVVLYAVYKLILTLSIFSKIDNVQTFEFIDRIALYLFILALVVIVLSIFAYLYVHFLKQKSTQDGLAHRPTNLTALSPTPQSSFIDWIDISDQIVNPSFEDGFLGWEEDSSVIDSEHAISQSVDDSSEAHSGTHSRKLFLREGGSFIKQTIDLEAPLPSHCLIRLGAYVKMPFRGDHANKSFSLMLVTRGFYLEQVNYTQIEQMDSLTEWTKATVQTEQLDYPIHKLEIHASTTRGGGVHKGFDQSVWVDDFTIEYQWT